MLWITLAFITLVVVIRLLIALLKKSFGQVQEWLNHGKY